MEKLAGATLKSQRRTPHLDTGNREKKVALTINILCYIATEPTHPSPVSISAQSHLNQVADVTLLVTKPSSGQCHLHASQSDRPRLKAKGLSDGHVAREAYSEGLLHS